MAFADAREVHSQRRNPSRSPTPRRLHPHTIRSNVASCAWIQEQQTKTGERRFRIGLREYSKNRARRTLESMDTFHHDCARILNDRHRRVRRPFAQTEIRWSCFFLAWALFLHIPCYEFNDSPDRLLGTDRFVRRRHHAVIAAAGCYFHGVAPEDHDASRGQMGKSREVEGFQASLCLRRQQKAEVLQARDRLRRRSLAVRVFHHFHLVQKPQLTEHCAPGDCRGPQNHVLQIGATSRGRSR